MSDLTIPRPPKPFPVSPWARRIAIFRAYLYQTKAAETAARQGRPKLAEACHREARRLLEESRS
jgi:hypothetical protein